MNDNSPTQLREALHRMAEDAPHLAVPAGLYRRARRDRRKRAAYTLAAAAAVALIAWTLPLSGGLLRGVSGPGPSGSTGRPGVPNRIYPVPQYVVDKVSEDETGALAGPVEPVEEVGQLAAVFTAGAPDWPVGISARDGRYHLLDVGAGNTGLFGNGTVALSPDGNHLAAFWGNGDSGRLKVVDLREGTSRTIRVTWVQPRLAWSPDSRWLAWAGTGSGSRNGSLLNSIGRLGPTGRADSFPASGQLRGLAVDRAGRLFALYPQRLRVITDGDNDYIPLDKGFSVLGPRLSLSPDSHRVSVGVFDRAAPVIDASGAGVTSIAPASADYPNDATTEPLAWLDANHLVGLVDARADASGISYEEKVDLVVMPAPTRPSQKASFRVIGSVPRLSAASLSIATDLITLDRPTVERPEPDWPPSPTQVNLLVLAAVASILFIAFLATRSRRRSRT